jgi:hypothetical protein
MRCTLVGHVSAAESAHLCVFVVMVGFLWRCAYLLGVPTQGIKKHELVRLLVEGGMIVRD